MSAPSLAGAQPSSGRARPQAACPAFPATLEARGRIGGHMAKPKKPPRPKAETPRGFRDYFGHEVVARQRMLDAITGVYRAYGFDPLESPAIETVEALGKFLPDVDRPNEGVFAWQDEDETW